MFNKKNPSKNQSLQISFNINEKNQIKFTNINLLKEKLTCLNK